MLRKVSAVTFMLVMAMVITLKHPVLGYCLCLDTYFAGNCVCAPTGPTAENTGCHGCCSTSETEGNQAPEPCEDCTNPLSIDTGDFVWDGSHKIPSENSSENPANTLLFSTEQSLTFQELTDAHMAIRGSPPPIDITLSTSVPIYLRHSVLRL